MPYIILDIQHISGYLAYIQIFSTYIDIGHIAGYLAYYIRIFGIYPDI